MEPTGDMIMDDNNNKNLIDAGIPLYRPTSATAEDEIMSLPSMLPRGEAFEEDDEESDSEGEYDEYGTDLECGEEIVLLEEPADVQSAEWSIKRDGVMMGLVVGCFIQFASLGARFMLTAFILHKEDDMVITRKNLVELSLGWSFLTSTMGVGLLFALGNLMSRGTLFSTTVMEGLRSNLELSFAIGALSSVCIAWSITDLVLGIPGHATESIFIWLGAVTWAKLGAVVSQYWTSQDQSGEDESLKEALLAKSVEKKTLDHRWTHGVNGLLVGCFIQFSSLGANFLLQAIFSDGIKAENGRLAQPVVLFSLVWSIATSAMGVAVLVLMRNILRAVSVSTENMECSFSLGAILGVNLSWIATDCILGYASIPSWWHWILVVGSLVCGAFL